MKDEVKRIIVLVIAIAAVVFIIKSIQNKDTTIKDLQKRGYNDTEINILLDNLNKEEIKNVIASEYNANLPKVLNSKYFIKDNMNKYLEYCRINTISKYCKPSMNVDEIISIINVGADKDWYSNTKEVQDTDSITMLVNKFNYLPASYDPEDIVEIKNWYAYAGHSIKEEVYKQFIKMFNDAKEEGLKLIINTSYRTFEDQEDVYDSSSDEYASRPGFSEHQTGLALDIVTYDSKEDNFEDTEEFEWLKSNAYKYGFILRYPKDKEYLTGYEYEPWHYRYIGVDLATKVYKSGLTYEEYYAYYCEYKNECK